MATKFTEKLGTNSCVTNERKYFYQENNMDLFRTDEVEPYMVVQNGNMLLPVLFYMYYKLNSCRFSAGLVGRKFGIYIAETNMFGQAIKCKD